LVYKKLDLEDLDSVKNFALEYKKEFSKLDILINNAGVYKTQFEETK
jgi:NADP-dependent 3-hydroxy acid dehydrogenase YdfG